MELTELSDFLTAQNVDFAIYRNKEDFLTASTGAQYHNIPIYQAAPTLILKSAENYFAAIIRGDCKISFKKLKKALNQKSISLADPNTVFSLTRSKVGNICMINENLTTLIDEKILANSYCYGGCGVPNATLRINTQDLVKVTNAPILDFTELKY